MQKVKRLTELAGVDVIVVHRMLKNAVPVPEYLLIRLAVPLVLSIAALLLWRSILLVPFALALGYVLPILWLRQRRSRRAVTADMGQGRRTGVRAFSPR